MKNLFISLSSVLLCLFFGGFFSSCEKDQLNGDSFSDQSSGEELSSRAAPYVLNVKLLADSIELRYKGKVPGLGYVIVHDGQTYYNNVGGLGYARSFGDQPYVAHSAQQRQGIASTSKLPTALLVVKLLELYGMSLNEPVYPYLPSNWKPHPDFKLITFKKLLAHETGLIKYGNQYADMKKMVEDGVQKDELYGVVRDYDNINYFLPHYLVAYMIGKKANPTLLSDLKKAESDTTKLKLILATQFTSAMRLYVFKPAGLLHWSSVAWRPWNNNGDIVPEAANKFYKTLDPNEKGSNPSDHFYSSGPGGLYISATEYGQMMKAASLGKIIRKGNYEIMRKDRLGFDSYGTWKRGTYAEKNGWSRSGEIAIDFGSTQIYICTNMHPTTVPFDRSFLVNLVNNCTK